PLYNLFERISLSSYKRLQMLTAPDSLVRNLKILIFAARAYFSVESTQEMLDEWRPLICPYHNSMEKAMGYFKLFLPTLLPPEEHQFGFKLWFHEFMDIWIACPNSRALESARDM